MTPVTASDAGPYRKTFGRFRQILVSALLWFLASTASAAEREIEVDGLLLPADAAAAAETTSPFAGAWIGRWDGVLKTILIVESVTGDGQARAIYSVAGNPSAGFDRAWFRLGGTVSGPVMELSGKGLSISVTSSPSGRLRAVFGDGFSFAVLKRQDLRRLIAKEAPVDWSIGTSEKLGTGLSENGSGISLETILYSPPGPGPYPLAVVNHGSTGPGTNEQAFKASWSNDWLADVLNARGYLVAFPQRRGRGQSDGLYDEGFGNDRSKGYTCDPKRSLAGAERALEDLSAAISALKRRPDVSGSPVLLAGMSRGGYLAAAHAGNRPDEVSGVVSFVGGWIGEGCGTADEINGTLARTAAGFKRPTLWLYGEDDPYYSIEHSRRMHALFTEAGGNAEFHVRKVRGAGNGHWVVALPPLWQSSVETYLDGLAK